MTTDDTRKRLDKLKSLQARHAAAPAEAPVNAAAANAGPRGGAGAGPRAGGQAKAGGAKGGSPMVQRLRAFLSDENGKIDRKKARKFFGAVRRQAADPEAPRHDTAKKILGFIERMSPEKRQKLMQMVGADEGAGMGGGGMGGGGMGGGRRGAGGGAGGAGRGGAMRGAARAPAEADDNIFDGFDDKF